jgi:class 3 adenylate cyclase
MRDPVSPSPEVGAIIRVARDETERSIARYRLWMTVLSGLVVTGLNVVRWLNDYPHSFFNTFYFGGAVAYALAAACGARRYGAHPVLVWGTLALDPVALVGNFPVYALAAPQMRPILLPYALHVVPPMLLFYVFVSSLRNSARVMAATLVVAIVVLLGIMLPLEGANIGPQLAGWGSAFLLSGLVGRASTLQGERSLERFARLQLLGRFLPPAAFARVMNAPDAGLSLGGGAVTLTVLAADLRGFTSMSENLAPEEVVRQLNDYHGRMLEEIDRADGALDKFIGDGILAIFGYRLGAPAQAADHGASAALMCARGMLSALESLNAARAAQSLPPLAMGIGVHTGTVVAGNIGAPGRRLEFTVIGDTVNTASRLEGLTKEAGVPLLLSAATVERLANAVPPLRELAPMRVKGREAPVRLFALDAAAPPTG